MLPVDLPIEGIIQRPDEEWPGAVGGIGYLEVMRSTTQEACSKVGGRVPWQVSAECATAPDKAGRAAADVPRSPCVVRAPDLL